MHFFKIIIGEVLNTFIYVESNFFHEENVTLFDSFGPKLIFRNGITSFNLEKY